MSFNFSNKTDNKIDSKPVSGMNVFKKIISMEYRSMAYISDNAEGIARQNQHMLISLNVLYTIIMGIYLLASYTLFADWNISHVYEHCVKVQCVLLIFVLVRYGFKLRSFFEIDIAASMFQLYVMFFVGTVSILPVEMKQPAVYFAPVAIGFSVVFVYSFYHTLVISNMGFLIYIIASAVFKDASVFFVDFCSSLFSAFMCSYINYVLFQYRIGQNDVKNELKNMAAIDQLTLLYNKSTAGKKVMEYIAKNKNSRSISYAYMVIDVDYFKKFNDTYGHKVGDEILAGFGAILSSNAADNGIAGRIGGDEFMLFLKDVTPEQAEKVADNINRELRTMKISHKECNVSCSIGIYYSTSAYITYEQLYTRADAALYQTKKNGRDGYFIHAN